MSFLSFSGENPAFAPIHRPRESEIGWKSRSVRREQSIQCVWPAAASCSGRALSSLLDLNSRDNRVDLKDLVRAFPLAEALRDSMRGWVRKHNEVNASGSRERSVSSGRGLGACAAEWKRPRAGVLRGGGQEGGGSRCRSIVADY